MDREDEVSKIFISTGCLDRLGNDFDSHNGFKFLTHLKSKTIQFKIILKSLALFNTQFRVKESFKLLLAVN